MNLDELTLGQIKEIQNMGAGNIKKHPYKLNQNYFIRTVTMIYLGTLKEIYEGELVISKASWVADTGRWSEACHTGNLSEVELYKQEHDVIIGRGAILDVSPWDHDLPKETK